MRELSLHTNSALFGYRPATLISWQAGGYFWETAGGPNAPVRAQGWYFNPPQTIAAGFPDRSSIHPAPSTWVRPAIYLPGYDWNWVKVGSVQGVATAAPNDCYFP